MANARLALSLHDFVILAPSPVRKGFLARLLAALAATRQREAEREIARYVAACGDKFTDETEREIERRFLSTPAHW